MPDEHVYLVAVDLTDPSVDREELVRLLKRRSIIKGWWSYIPGCFLVSTALGAGELADEVIRTTNQALILVAKIDPAKVEGWLPPQAWRWIEKRATEPEAVEVD